MQINPKATLLLDINARTLRELFDNAADREREDAFLSSFMTLSFYKWPTTNFALFMALVIPKRLPDIAVTNEQMDISDQGLSLTTDIWMRVGDYFKAQEIFKATHPEDRPALEAFNQQSLSFHFWKRSRVFENFVEVATRETETSAFLQADLVMAGGKVIADMSDCHDDP
ncbi:MAG: hypothetical protein H6867_10875, partial [Rhodospirillales bacterium]|nr:hypothetical protein [Rhodospirillales bacterium]